MLSRPAIGFVRDTILPQERPLAKCQGLMKLRDQHTQEQRCRAISLFLIATGTLSGYHCTLTVPAFKDTRSRTIFSLKSHPHDPNPIPTRLAGRTLPRRSLPHRSSLTQMDRVPASSSSWATRWVSIDPSLAFVYG